MENLIIDSKRKIFDIRLVKYTNINHGYLVHVIERYYDLFARHP